MDNQNAPTSSSESILDRVISSKHHLEIQSFNPEEVISELFRNLSSKEEDILRRRHGLHGKEHETLETVGAAYKVTRERIRQIEHLSIGKIRDILLTSDALRPIEHVVHTTISGHGGAMSEQHLLDELLKYSSETLIANRALLFILTHLLSDKFVLVPETNVLRTSWRLPITSVEGIEEVIRELEQMISESRSPLLREDIIRQFGETLYYEEHAVKLTEDAIVSYLGMSQAIDRNPFDEYGLKAWGSIRPRRMNDKIYLVLKKHGKPMHFSEITDAINHIHFDDRVAYPPTIHNELILNDRYVLVGRGMYALKEWGYKPGVVADVIAEILVAEGPLTRDEITAKVLEQRVVKKNTISLALTNKGRFQKLDDGRYSLRTQTS